MGRNFKRYLRQSGIVVLAVLGLTVAAAVLIDPYNLHGSAETLGLWEKKPSSYRLAVQAKLARAGRAAPRTLLVGNSRIDGGIDPQDPVWPAAMKPVFNLGIPGQGFSGNVDSMMAMQGFDNVRTVVAGLDFVDFLTRCEKPKVRKASSGTRLPPPDWVRTHLSLTVLIDAWNTVRAQRNPHAANMRPDGFNTWSYIVPVYRHEGVFTVFEQKNLSYMQRMSAAPERLSCPDGPSAELRALQRLLDETGKRRQDLLLFIHPYHSDFLQIFEMSGLWPTLERFHALIRQTVAADRFAGQRRLALWSFVDYAGPTLEAVPARGDTKTEMHWYYESGHYRPALGRLVVERLLHGDADGLGVDMLSGDLQAYLKAQDGRRREFLLRQPSAQARLEALWQRAGIQSEGHS